MKQHYAPSLYPALFVDRTTEPPRTPHLWVADFDKRKVSAKAPINVAARTDYNVLGERDGRADHSVEEMFSEFEFAALPVLKPVAGDVESGALDPRDLQNVLPFVATQFTRISAVRDRLSLFRLDVANSIARLMVHDRAQYERDVLAAHPGGTFTAEELESVYNFARDSSNYTSSYHRPVP